MGTRDVMNAWGASKGEALHTQTFLGHPVGCAAALAVLRLIEREQLHERASVVGAYLAEALTSRGFAVHGRGLMMGVTLPNALATTRHLLERGYLTLPAGPKAEYLGLTPPVCLTEAQIEGFAHTLAQVA